jgi:internalin A
MPNDLTLARKLIKKCVESQNTYLDLGNCGIDDLNDLPGLFECTHLQSLNLSTAWWDRKEGQLWSNLTENKGKVNTFETVPSKIGCLRNLKRLIVCGKANAKISNIDFLENLTGLQHLDLYANRISDIRFLENLVNLEYLDLCANGITDISFLKGLNKLIHLEIGANKITDIRALKGLRNLRHLGIDFSDVSDVNSLGKLTKLKYLSLKENQISDVLPLVKLGGLNTLGLSTNKIKRVPIEIFQSGMEIDMREDAGNGLCLFGNPIESPPLEIIEQGKQSVLNWFEARKKKLNEIKIILIGDPKSGKTSLLRRLKDDTFDENEAQTDGINIEDIQFGECKTFKAQTSLHQLTAHFWDFGGQEIMNATHQFFLTNRSVYLLVLDARKDTDIASQIRQWVKRIKTTGGSSPIIVVANQADVNAGFGFSNESDLQKEFPEIRHFIKISCKTGVGIDEIKNKLEGLIPQAELFNTEIDERWIAVKEQLQEETKSKHFLDETRFKEICNNNGLNENAGRRNAINFLHDLGLVLHFEELSLAQYYVLDPYWITYGVYQIVTSAEAGRLKGIVGMDRLEYIVNEEEDKKDVYKSTHFEKIIYDTNQRRFLVDILNQFKLCFYLPGNAGFIIPNLLDTTEPIGMTNLIKNDADCIRFVYKYGYLTNSVLPNIMVEAHSLLCQKWRTGCILENNGCQALISTYQDELTITVAGDHKKKREFMAVIRHCIDTINQKLAVKPKMLIPLPGIVPVACAEYEVLLNREKKGRKEFIFDEDKPTEKSFDISQLLEGIATPDEIMEISRDLKNIKRDVKIVIEKLDKHYQYLITKLNDDQISHKIVEAVNELNVAQTSEITKEILKQIATGFDLLGGDMDEKLKKIYLDLKETDDVEAKLKLSIPFIKLLGIDFEVGFDVKSWATKMYNKYQLQIFKLMGAV